MRKIQKRYYILIFVVVVAFSAIIRDIATSSSFEIIKNPTAYAPEVENIVVDEDEYRGYVVNINTGSIPELSILPGIGEKTAERIIEYRTKYGNFETVEDIMKVSGIGSRTFEDIKNNITVK